MIIYNRFNRFFTLSAVIFISLNLTACMMVGVKSESIRSELALGHIDNALAIAEQEDANKKDVLASLNKGMLRRLKGNYQGSNLIFEVAKKEIEALYGVSVSEQAGALVVNDTLRSYSGDRYEQVLLHAYMAMNYIEMDDLDAARVEMLQAGVKMQEWGEQPEEDPFVRYLSGMIFEALGEKDEALISYRLAKEAYKETNDKQNLAVPMVLKKDLLRSLQDGGFTSELRLLKKEFNMKKFKPEVMAEGFGELVIILSSRLAPIRQENSIMMNVTGKVVDTVKIALPIYGQSGQRFHARFTTNNDVQLDLEMVADIDALARSALDADLPLITTRAIARAIVKHEVQERVEKHDALMGFLATMVNVATENADTRSWVTLPQSIQLARVKLRQGKQTVNIEIYNAADLLVDTIKKNVDIKSGQSAFLTEHWLVPNLPLKLLSNK